MNKIKIGICITTYNTEHAFSALWKTIPKNLDYTIVVVNGGHAYKEDYSNDCHWIQHSTNLGPARARNDGMNYLYEQGCDYLFCVEDDMLILKPNTFQAYVDALINSKHQYLCYASFSQESGIVGNRTPNARINYSNCVISCYPNMTNEFSVRTRNLWEKLGNYSTEYYSMFDVDSVYRSSLLPEGPCFWYFPDLANGDEYVTNNLEISSRIDAGGKRTAAVSNDLEIFYKKYSIIVPHIPKLSLVEMFNKIKNYK